ncbi:MAG: glycosyl transferase [Proteobacteria bacterium]|nr:MAG: glycosyl transferase [Pseudomonadota bacterium]
MSAEPKLSIVIPAYNEAERLPPTLDAVRAWLDAVGWDAEIVVVNDGSSDGTRDLLEGVAAADPRVVPVTHADNAGKGAALVSGVAVARGERLVFFDADLSYALDNLAFAMARLDDGAELVIGARDLVAGDSRRDYGPLRRLASWTFNGLVERALHLGIRDTQCGFKAFRTEVARPLFAALTIGGFGFDVELLFIARRWGLRIDLIPVVMEARGGSSVSVVRHSVRMARDVFAIRRRARRGGYPERPASA